jgi:hypothetical protein
VNHALDPFIDAQECYNALTFFIRKVYNRQPFESIYEHSSHSRR